LFSIKAQIVLWLIAGLIAVPLISTLGLDRPKDADAGLSPEEREYWRKHRLRQAFELLGTIGGTMGILYLMQRGMRDDVGGLVYGIGVLFLWTFGLIIAVLVIAVIQRFLSEGARTGFFIILYGFFLFGFVLPLSYDNSVKRAAHESQEKIRDAYGAAKMRLRTSWTADLRAAGAHGAEGVVPPMLDVIDSGQGVQVTNIGDQTVCLDLRRSHARLGIGLDYQCALWSERGGLHSCVEFKPGQSEWLRMSSARPDLPDCSGQPLEFRVGAWETTGPGWWSDAALDDFDRQTARLETDRMMYETVITAPYVWKDAMLVEVTYAMNSMPVGPPRVAVWREQLAAAEVARAAMPNVTSEQRASQASRLNQIGEVEAQLRAIESLRERVSRSREKDQQFPDYLPVEDQLDRVTVRHPLGAVFYRSLARAGMDPQTGEEFLCEMRGLGRGNSAGTYVSATEPGNFAVMSRTGHCANLENTRLEMVVNDFNGRLTFASPSALDRMHARTEALLKSLHSNGTTQQQVELNQ